MTSETKRAPDPFDGADVEKPAASRIYDWMLGGTNWWSIDRHFGQKMLTELPVLPDLFMTNRRWMNRVVRAALDAGITQFLDLGAGIPTSPDSATPAHQRPPANVHDLVGDELGPRGRVVYVDHESVAAAHTTITLDRQGCSSWAGVVQNDLRAPKAIMTNTTTTGLLDFSQPVCVLMISVLHFLGPADHPGEVIAGYRSHLAPGSWLAISHGASAIPDDPELERQLTTVAGAYHNTQNPGWLRDRDEVAALFAGTELLEPGLVHLPDWRPDGTPDKITQNKENAVRGAYWCGVGEVAA